MNVSSAAGEIASLHRKPRATAASASSTRARTYCNHAAGAMAAGQRGTGNSLARAHGLGAVAMARLHLAGIRQVSNNRRQQLPGAFGERHIGGKELQRLVRPAAARLLQRQNRQKAHCQILVRPPWQLGARLPLGRHCANLFGLGGGAE